MNWRKYALIAFLAGVTLFTSVAYFSLLRETGGLQTRIKETERKLVELENSHDELTGERNRFAQDNTRLREELSTNQAVLTDFRERLGFSEKALEDLTARFEIARSENVLLAQEVTMTRQQARKALEERDQLQARLSSVHELKQAIRDLRHAGRRERVKAKRQVFRESPAPAQRRNDSEDVLLVGNGGFLIKDGKPTSCRITIHVKPASAEN